MKHLKITTGEGKAIHIANSTIVVPEVFIRLKIELYPQPELIGFVPLVYENQEMFNSGVSNQLKTDLEFTPTQGMASRITTLSEEQQADKEQGAYEAARLYFENKGYEVQVISNS